MGDCPEGCGGKPTCAAPPLLPIECGESNEEHCFYVQDFCTQARSTTWLAFGQSLRATVPTPRPTPNPIPQPMMTASKLGVCLCGFPELFCKVPGWSGTVRHVRRPRIAQKAVGESPRVPCRHCCPLNVVSLTKSIVSTK